MTTPIWLYRHSTIWCDFLEIAVYAHIYFGTYNESCAHDKILFWINHKIVPFWELILDGPIIDATVIYR